jgi:hypothetical protein
MLMIYSNRCIPIGIQKTRKIIFAFQRGSNIVYLSREARKAPEGARI